MSFQAGQRSGGGRGGNAAPNAWGNVRSWISPDDVRSQGAWWTNTATIARLGLTDDQKTRLEKSFESHRQDLASRTDTLNKEEAQLAKLLEADPLDRNAVFAQIDRVTQARSELERANSVMTLEMREVLTRAQWMQLQPPQRARVSAAVAIANLIMPVVAPVTPSGATGSVTLEVEISKEGTVDDLRAMTGDPALLQAASAAVKQWHYLSSRSRPAPRWWGPGATISHELNEFNSLNSFNSWLIHSFRLRSPHVRYPESKWTSSVLCSVCHWPPA